MFSSFTARRVPHSITHVPESGPWYCPQRSRCLQRVVEGAGAWSWTAGSAEPSSQFCRSVPGKSHGQPNKVQFTSVIQKPKSL